MLPALTVPGQVPARTRPRTRAVFLAAVWLLTLFVGAAHSGPSTPPPQTAQQRPTTAADVKVLRQEAEQGDAEAQSKLGLAYAKGQGVPQDYGQAVAWCRRAADQGNAEGQRCLGVAYVNAAGVPQDFSQAAAWFRKSADQGNARAQHALGIFYLTGQGVPQDFAQAVAWSRKSAEQGDAEAQSNLGAMYVNGYGVAQDYAQAMAWFRKSADQGTADAQYNLGLMYRDGQGVRQDPVEAHKWISVAVARTSGAEQSQFAASRDALAQKMTPTQIAEAQRRATEWMAAFEKRKKERSLV